MASPATTRPVEDQRELTTALDALQCRTKPVPLDAVEEIAKKISAKHAEATHPYTHSKRSNRRAMLALSLFVLLLGGVLQLATSTPQTRSGPNEGSRANVVFSNALTGTCLAWPPDSPDKPSFVQCSDNHMFEVARPVGMQNFMEPCQLAVRDYLGSHFDPNSRFTSTVLWAGDEQGAKTDDRNLLCGLQLPGPDGRPIPFKRMVAEQDQSKVWPAGTCLGIDAQTGRSTDMPVPCSAPHAVEVTGTVNLRDQFPDARPIEPDQDGFLRGACTRMTDEYLAPKPLNVTGQSVNYTIMSAASWNAGSRLVACEIGTRRGDDGWVPLVGAAKGVGQAPAPPPEAIVPPPVRLPPPPVASTTVAPAPTPVATPAPTTTTAPSAASATSTAATTAPQGPGPPPGPPATPTPASAGAPPPPPTPESVEPGPNVVNIGGVPITLPWDAPPPPPPG
jgi:Septum formation